VGTRPQSRHRERGDVEGTGGERVETLGRRTLWVALAGPAPGCHDHAFGDAAEHLRAAERQRHETVFGHPDLVAQVCPCRRSSDHARQGAAVDEVLGGDGDGIDVGHRAAGVCQCGAYAREDQLRK
jgi:hypothetical protein